MPIHEFECGKCGFHFEYLILSAGDNPSKCPECRSKKVNKLISAGSFRPQGIPTGSGGFEPPACSSTGCPSAGGFPGKG